MRRQSRLRTRVLGFTVLLLLSAACWARHIRGASGNDAAILANCPTQGDAKNPSVRALNVLKRRITSPAATDMDAQVTMAAMLAPGNDTDRFDTKRGGTLEG